MLVGTLPFFQNLGRASLVDDILSFRHFQHAATASETKLLQTIVRIQFIAFQHPRLQLGEREQLVCIICMKKNNTLCAQTDYVNG